ncbi:MAG: hypothetical protein ACI88H_003069 [Cocleimonas sp.]|jgi:hypothetical protein
MTSIVKFSRLLKISIFSLFLTGASIVSQQAFAQPTALPDAFSADYKVARGGMTLGNLHASLKYSGNNYQYQKYTKATGIAALLTGIKITENTNGQLSGLNVIPKNYLFNQSRRSKSRIDQAEFVGRKAIGSYKDTPYNVVIPHGTQDRASLELVLARDIAQNKAQLKYNVFERGKIKQYSFQKMGKEEIKTPAGTFSATKVKVIREGTKRETIFWLAEKIDYLPVKVKHTEKGEVITTVIKRYQKL